MVAMTATTLRAVSQLDMANTSSYARVSAALGSIVLAINSMEGEQGLSLIRTRKECLRQV